MVTAVILTENNIAQVVCEYEDRESAKTLGARWDAQKKIWYFPYITYGILDTLKKNDVPLDFKLEELWEDLHQKQNGATDIKRGDIPNDDESFLYLHQRKTLLFSNQIGSYADLSDCGTGKTISTLSIIETHTQDNPHFKCLVIAPKSIIISAWCEDAKRFENLKVVPVMGAKKRKLDAFQEDANVYITNYETMNQDFKFEEPFDMLVCDEAVRLKNPNAKWTKNIKKLSRSVKYKIIISGLITPNNLMEVYSPFDIVEPHILGKSFYQFKNKYFTPNPFSYMNKEWVPKKGSHENIMNKIERLIIRHRKDECLDLPEKIHTIREVEMGVEQKRMYLDMAKKFVVEVEEGTITAVNAGAKLQKLQQITSGFIYNNEEEKKSPIFFKNQKSFELYNLLEGELADKQVIIFCTYRGEIEMFKKYYPKSSFIYGGQSDTSQQEAIEDFKSGANRLLFANVKASKYGLTFTNCSDIIYYSLSYSLDDVYQSQERIHRIGQNNTCNYIYLLTKNSIDKRVYNAVMKKQSLNDMVFEIIEDIKKGVKK